MSGIVIAIVTSGTAASASASCHWGQHRITGIPSSEKPLSGLIFLISSVLGCAGGGGRAWPLQSTGRRAGGLPMNCRSGARRDAPSGVFEPTTRNLLGALRVVLLTVILCAGGYHIGGAVVGISCAATLEPSGGDWVQNLFCLGSLPFGIVMLPLLVFWIWPTAGAERASKRARNRSLAVHIVIGLAIPLLIAGLITFVTRPAFVGVLGQDTPARIVGSNWARYAALHDWLWAAFGAVLVAITARRWLPVFCEACEAPCQQRFVRFRQWEGLDLIEAIKSGDLSRVKELRPGEDLRVSIERCPGCSRSLVTLDGPLVKSTEHVKMLSRWLRPEETEVLETAIKK